MPAFKELKDCDVITVTYEAHPSMHLSWSYSGNAGEGRSQVVTILSRSSGVTYENFSGEIQTGSLHISGAAQIKAMNPGGGPSPLTGAIHSIYRARDVYCKNAFERSEVYSVSSFWADTSNPLSFTGSAIYIPHVLYGEQIKPKTVRLLVNRITNGNPSVVEYIDDGMGCLVSSSTDLNNYNSVISKMKGAVFYHHGIVMFLETGYIDEVTPTTMSVDLYFSGTNQIPMNMYICKVEKGDGNFSLNPSFTSYLTSSSESEITTKNPKAFITGIGLYDENYELVGVAKLATPILNEEKNSVTFKLKLNF